MEPHPPFHRYERWLDRRLGRRRKADGNDPVLRRLDAVYAELQAVKAELAQRGADPGHSKGPE